MATMTHVMANVALVVIALLVQVHQYFSMWRTTPYHTTLPYTPHVLYSTYSTPHQTTPITPTASPVVRRLTTTEPHHTTSHYHQNPISPPPEPHQTTRLSHNHITLDHTPCTLYLTIHPHHIHHTTPHHTTPHHTTPHHTTTQHNTTLHNNYSTTCHTLLCYSCYHLYLVYHMCYVYFRLLWCSKWQR